MHLKYILKRADKSMSKQVFIPLSAVQLTPKPKYPAILALGFRPFYLLAAAWMVAALPLWMLMWGHGFFTQSHLSGIFWHSHELIFGFASAVIVGFLFTAVRNWSGHPTPQGYHLALIAVAWIGARILLLTQFSPFGAILDVIFFALSAIGLAVPLWRSGNTRNYFFVVLVSLLGVLSALHHLAALDLLSFSGRGILHTALGIIAVIITVMAGRVVPMFTANAVPGAPVKRWPLLESIAVISIIASIIAMMFLSEAVASVVLVLAAGIHLYRWINWAPLHTLKLPILWILHFSYVWLPIAMLLLALPTTWLPMKEMLAIHAFTTGTICGLCIGMMSRTARGHTGRPLKASAAEVTAYTLVLISALLRVMLPLLSPDYYRLWTGLASIPMVIAFAIYLAVFSPWLFAPRADGKPG